MQPRPAGALDRLLEFFLIPSVRYAAAAIVLLITLTSMAQLLTMLNEISTLERCMASPGKNEAAEATYTVQSKTLEEAAKSKTARSIQENISVTVTNGRIDIPAKDIETLLSDSNLRNLPAILGTAALRIDKKTFDKIVNEVKATAELTFRVRHEGA
jgi:hypothetical protein